MQTPLTCDCVKSHTTHRIKRAVFLYMQTRFSNEFPQGILFSAYIKWNEKLR